MFKLVGIFIGIMAFMIVLSLFGIEVTSFIPR